MQWLVDNFYIVVLIISIITNIAIFVITKLSGGKQTKLVKSLTAVQNVLPEIISIAEKVGANGEDRKTYAMSQVKIMCQAVGLKATDEQIEYFSKTIDELVGLTKQINNKNTAIDKIGAK